MQNPSRKRFSFIIDEFAKKRGDPSMLHIFCGKCQESLLIYQKDGSGPLKRCYLDRIHKSFIEIKAPLSMNLIQCPHCQRKLGCLDAYEKENRLAIYWFVSCIYSFHLKRIQ